MPIKETSIEIINANHLGLKLKTDWKTPQIIYTIPVVPAKVEKLPQVKNSCGLVKGKAKKIILDLFY